MVANRWRLMTIQASINAPEIKRSEVKLAASISVSSNAARHKSEFAAKASMANAVHAIVRNELATKLMPDLAASFGC